MLEDRNTQLINQFTLEATDAGSIVYVTRDYSLLKEQLSKLVKEHCIRRIVKSDWMSETNIGLKEYLIKMGVEVIETSYVDYWIKRNGEKINATQPSSDIKNKCDADTRKEFIRRTYVNADMGISEASIAIAETGSVLLTNNEGNDRFVTLIPRIHLSLIDCQNIVATMDEATERIKSGEVPTFLTYLTGRNTTGDIPGALGSTAQGPELEYIILFNC
jgi:L-lactate utilization protein LutB